jgi:3-dehydroquinate dehydratase-2
MPIRKILVINGPNLNLLGRREPEIYGSDTLDDINRRLFDYATAKHIELATLQSNSEGAIIDALHQAMGRYDGIIINPGAYTHYSYAIYDAILAVGIPTVEVHLSDINKRELFRRVSVTAPACKKQISGRGWMGYIEAIDYLLNMG